ncbi:complement receptor type 1-like isoform X2 [Chrysemys picta bellii]|uniref:complement receptor type 1-like isoform X2 n=1 Tax=Chrysemys picta bellii TaxID=8478 RepID=UPI0032B19859
MSPGLPSPALALGLLALLLPGTRGDCGPLPKLNHAIPSDMDRIEGFPVETQVTYRCRDGFVKIPGKSDTVVCLSNSQWSNINEFCGRSCGAPTRLKFAALSKEDESKNYHPVGVTVRYTCRPGYENITEMLLVRTCLENLTWSEAPEFCRMITCPSPPYIANGTYDGRGVENFAYNSTVTYRCDPGFRLIGAASIHCTTKDKISGIWSGPAPECKGRPCKPLELENGRVDLTDLRFGTTANFSCSKGYKIIGPTSAQCVLKGNGVDWDEEVPLCQGSCDDPPYIRNTFQDHSNGNVFPAGTVVKYNCVRGYELIPGISASVTCQKDFTWSEHQEFCRKIRCPFPNIPNGRAILGKATYEYEDKIRIECNPGYALKDHYGSIKCESDRAWNPPLPICEPACEPPARISNGRDDRSWKNVFLVGSSLTYECDRGWSLVGVSSIRCIAGDGGTPCWDAPVPECKACEPPARISNGWDDRAWKNVFLVGSSVTYECDRGWSLIGVSSIRCVAGDGGTPRWDAPVPECKGSCDDPPYIRNTFQDHSNGNVFPAGTVVKYNCVRGYELIPGISSASVTCQKDFTWSEHQEFCRKIRCPFPNIRNGRAIPGKATYEYEDKIRVECNPSVALKDKNGSIKCESDRAWHPPLPICEPACETPARISNGRDDRGWKNVFLVGSSVTYSCNRGWSLVGVSSIRCIAGDGGAPRWNAPVPECKACEPPAPVSNGRYDRDWERVFRVGSSVTYECDRGWSLVGVSSIRCIAGDGGTPRWNAPAPECKGSCGDPPYIRNTFQDPSNSNLFPSGTVVKYNCVGGYELIPGISSASVTCQKDFTWSEHQEFCRKIRCPFPNIRNGRAIPGKATYEYEDKIRIECNPGVALKDNYGSIKCERNGAWHPPLPICEPACEPPARVSNGRDDRGREPVFLVGSSVSYFCNRGWSLVGVSSIRCIAGDGETPRWNAPVPECKACEPPARVSNGRDDRGWEPVFLVGSSVTYVCNRGWSLVGVSSIRCIAGDGGTPRWDAPVPECKGEANQFSSVQHGS